MTLIEEAEAIIKRLVSAEGYDDESDEAITEAAIARGQP
jgi:hypothetical protein